MNPAEDLLLQASKLTLQLKDQPEPGEALRLKMEITRLTVQAAIAREIGNSYLNLENILILNDSNLELLRQFQAYNNAQNPIGQCSCLSLLKLEDLSSEAAKILTSIPSIKIINFSQLNITAELIDILKASQIKQVGVYEDNSKLTVDGVELLTNLEADLALDLGHLSEEEQIEASRRLKHFKGRRLSIGTSQGKSFPLELLQHLQVLELDEITVRLELITNEEAETLSQFKSQALNLAHLTSTLTDEVVRILSNYNGKIYLGFEVLKGFNFASLLDSKAQFIAYPDPNLTGNKLIEALKAIGNNKNLKFVLGQDKEVYADEFLQLLTKS
ncbi:hypothetical protein A2272_03975 [Candidatus Peregrinibacteria bacterium RIFOXYA12_FULL_33_12]|nr:MAG: hypothetical protein A2263_03735 [Candidatus Peregrinibacteria bacterium RIFOXYA2_FULL_33_21]OGJ46592.1 MAG: hypothetical protein A2272_03975 [Candidatus Peregrinibacteria bacterium RIFOXYA12_FULL_33_12]OGJ51470.1 MAG: hypothetical protein A2307_00170 [Candidatus Peregrinibacteria bacterium RIFOXYB2_FULL_33_20]